MNEIDGVGVHEEDSWIGREVRIGQAVIAPLGDVGRCLVRKWDREHGTSDLDTFALSLATGETASPSHYRLACTVM